jgi:predicted transcriptional regulator of viral defense system
MNYQRELLNHPLQIIINANFILTKITARVYYYHRKVSASRNSLAETYRVTAMRNVDTIRSLFDAHDGMMRTGDLSREKIYYADIQWLIREGYIEKVRTGYYQWIKNADPSELSTIVRLFPDGILCMDTALRHYGYSDRTPAEWHLAVSKDSNKTRFHIDYPFVKPYFVEPDLLELGLTSCEIEGVSARIVDKERAICDCLRYRNKMDREIFNKAIRSYISDPEKSIPNLMAYAKPLRVVKPVRDLIGVWL